MGIFDIFKRKKEDKNEIKENVKVVILKKEDVHTKLIIYYECKISLDDRTLMLAKIDGSPKDQIIYNLDDYAKDSPYSNKIYKAVEECEYILERKKSEEEEYFSMINLYNLKNIEKDNNVKTAYEKYTALKNKLILKCNNLNINLENNEQEIFNRILDEIDEEERKFTKEHGFKSFKTVKFCQNKDSVDIELQSQLDGKYDLDNFMFAKRHLCGYYASYIEDFMYLLEILDKENLNENEKEVLKNYTELFKILPLFIDRLDYLDYCINEIDKTRIESTKNRLEKNRQFIEDLTNLFSKSNTDYEDLYIHATTSSNNAKLILDRGLYIYSDELEDFSFPYQDFDQIFSYEYCGNLSNNQAQDYIIIFRLPKNDVDLETISEDEAKEAMAFINMRRIGLIIPPSGKISPENILGVIDKSKMIVLANDKFKTGLYNHVVKK